MTATVEVPVWLALLAGFAALWVVLERLLLPSVRWFFRRRANQVIQELNRRLALDLPTFSLTKREVLVDRLSYDPTVLAATRAWCESTGTPWAVGLARVESHAREIVPAFNAYLYFRVGNALARRAVARLYRVRLAGFGKDGLQTPDPGRASIVFVMNHRSNMDYVLVAYLAKGHAALSFAVGEWARVWPLQQLIRALGGYFVRRDSGDVLYRRVLARYVEMAVEGGAVQAVFPEGGLSRDGLAREPRLGLIDYMLRGLPDDDSRDLLFVPVALNYDRVLEDRSLIRRPDARRRSTLAAMGVAAGFLVRGLWRRLRGRWQPMGYAAAAFGAPLSLRDWCRKRNVDPRSLAHERRREETRRLADDLMARVAALMPVLPVPLMAWVLLGDPARVWSRADLEAAFAGAAAGLAERGGGACVPREDPAHAVEVGLRMLRLRRLVDADGQGYRVVPEEMELLRYYANSVRHLLEPAVP